MIKAITGILARNPQPLPLDLISNTNIIAASSNRRLRAAHSGAVVQVRRNSDNGLLDIGTTSNGDFDVSSLNSYVLTNTGTIRIWYNQAGLANTYDFVQGTNINQPIIRLTGTNYFINSRPVISGFKNNQTYLQTSNIVNLINGTDFTIIMVCTGTSQLNGFDRWVSGRSQIQSPVDNQSGGFSITSGNSWNTISFTGGTNQYCYPGGGSGNIVTPSVVTFYTNSTSVTGRVNGSLSRTENFTTNFSIDALALFGSANGGNSISERIGEIIVFKRTLSLSEIQLIERNMGTYYGITIA